MDRVRKRGPGDRRHRNLRAPPRQHGVNAAVVGEVTRFRPAGDANAARPKISKRYGDKILSMALSHDSTFLAITSYDRTIRVRNLKTGKLQILQGHKNIVPSAQFSPINSSVIVSCSHDQTIIVWCLDPQGELPPRKHVIEGQHSHFVNCVAFAPNGRVVASGAEDAVVRLWDVSSMVRGLRPLGNLHPKLLRAHSRGVLSCAFSPDGELVASVGKDTAILVWRVSDGARLVDILHHKYRIHCVSFSPCRQVVQGRLQEGASYMLATASKDKTVSLWDLSLPSKAGAAGMMKVDENPPSEETLGKEDKVDAKCDRPNAKPIMREQMKLKGHRYGVLSCAFSPDGKLLVSGGMDGIVRLWRVSSGDCLASLETSSPDDENHTAVVTCAFLPEANKLVAMNFEGIAQCWSLLKGQELREMLERDLGKIRMLFEEIEKATFSSYCPSASQVGITSVRKEKITSVRKEKLKGDGEIEAKRTLKTKARQFLSALRRREFRKRVQRFIKDKKIQIGSSTDSATSSKALFRSPFVPTCHEAVNQFLDLAKVTGQDTVCDIGCGDGRVLIASARRGARAIGFEIEEKFYKRAFDAVAQESRSVKERVTIINEKAEGKRLVEALKRTTVVFLFLLPDAIRVLQPILIENLPRKARIVTFTFKFGDMQPVEEMPYRGNVTPLRLYIVP